LDSSHVVYDNGGDKNEEAWSYLDGDALFGSMDGYLEQKEILKQALSEYQLYTIEGRETIPDGWGKRLPSFDVQEIGVTNLYKYDEQRWGNSTMRFLSFANTEACKLGEDPLPNGTVRVFRNVDEASSFVMPQQQPNVHNEAGSFVYVPVSLSTHAVAPFRARRLPPIKYWFLLSERGQDRATPAPRAERQRPVRNRR
jgi:hypothetical protein